MEDFHIYTLDDTTDSEIEEYNTDEEECPNVNNVFFYNKKN